MKAPLGARLEVPGRAPVDVSEILDDFSFRLSADGGFAGAQGKLWASIDDYDIRANAKLIVTNGADAETLWEGYLDSPGDSFDETGEAFDLSAQGAMTLVGDQAEQLLYIDTSYDHWRADDRNDNRLAPSAQASVSSWPDSEQDALLLQFASGTPIGKNDEARIIHDLATTCPMGIGGYGAKVKCGITSNGYKLRVTLSTPDAGTEVEQLAMDSSTQFAAGVIGINIPQVENVLKFRLRRTAGATNIGTDRIWAGFADPHVVGDRWDRYGNSQLAELGFSADLSKVFAHEIVEDLTARLMPMVDPNRVTIWRSGTYEIDQLTYAEPTRATGVLQDLALFEPDMLWRVEPSGADGRFGFTYKEWPTTPHYEISIADGYDAPGSDSSMCNRVAVGWVDRRGVDRVTIVTRYVPELGGTQSDPLGGRIVDAEKIDLDEALSSEANATRIGNQWLRILNDPAKAATATVVRRVRELRHGGTVAPWEIRPGRLARLRETGENLRITEVEVDTETLEARLTLGTPKPTIEQLMARLANRRRRR